MAIALNNRWGSGKNDVTVIRQAIFSPPPRSCFADSHACFGCLPLFFHPLLQTFEGLHTTSIGGGGKPSMAQCCLPPSFPKDSGFDVSVTSEESKTCLHYMYVTCFDDLQGMNSGQSFKRQ
jgi:hypothetical protein